VKNIHRAREVGSDDRREGGGSFKDGIEGQLKKKDRGGETLVQGHERGGKRGKLQHNERPCTYTQSLETVDTGRGQKGPE